LLGESPLWDAPGARIAWVDVLARTISSSAEDGSGHRVDQVSDHPGCIAARASGGRIIAFRRSIALADATGALRPLSVTGFDPDIERFNEGACDAAGRFWVGTMDRRVKEPVGGLYRIDPDLTSRRVAAGLTLSNGIAWNPDGSRLYQCDSGPRVIYVHDFDVATGELGPRRLFTAFGAGDGMPDGCAMDEAGHLWVAAPGTGSVLRFAPDGTKVASVAVPTREPTSVCFGGADLATLYVTSMQPHGGHDASPDDGGLYALKVGIRGLPRHPFGG
jgi:sugar lactone lactonase YvrE